LIYDNEIKHPTSSPLFPANFTKNETMPRPDRSSMTDYFEDKAPHLKNPQVASTTSLTNEMTADIEDEAIQIEQDIPKPKSSPASCCHSNDDETSKIHK
jgi:hypothetical protein